MSMFYAHVDAICSACGSVLAFSQRVCPSQYVAIHIESDCENSGKLYLVTRPPVTVSPFVSLLTGEEGKVI